MKTFREIYNEIPNERTVTTMRGAFVARIAKVTMKSEKTVRQWLSGVAQPDPLTKTVIAKELGEDAEALFPKGE